MKYKFPKESELAEIRERLSNCEPNFHLPENASYLDTLKYKMCDLFIIYRRVNNITQVELSRRLGVDEARVSEILRHKISSHSLDRLIELGEKIGLPRLKISDDAA